MDVSRFQRVQALFLSAADLPESERRAFLAASCDDKEVFADVLAMLQEDAGSGSLLDSDVAHVAEQMLGQPQSGSAVPERFGPYRLGRLLGEGGMGSVYLATRDDLGSVVAIKILRDAWLSPARRERFLSEQKMLAQLNDPAIARIYDAEALPDGTPWFAMEYVEGVSLTEYCATHKCTIDERLRLFRSACEPVQFAHEHAVIHRDLKPSNILVKDNGVVKLLDFGIAKQLATLDQPVDQTRTELRMMTPAYAAPEQIRGEQVGIFTDVYALGVILYELLTGHLPFDLSTRTPGEAERVILEQEPERPSLAAKEGQQASKGAWSDLDVLCLTAMQKEVPRRYRSVEGLIRDVDHYLHAEPLEARPDSWNYRLGKFLRRNRRTVLVTALVGAAVFAMALFFTIRLTMARNTAVAAVARMQTVQQFMLNLFQGGDKSVGPSTGLRVITIVDRGVKEAQTLKGDPEVQAELYYTLGGIYQKLGNPGQAESLLTASLEQRKALFGPDRPEVGQSLVSLGLLRLDQAHLDEAEKLVREGLDKIARARPVDAGAEAKATMALGKVLEARGSYVQAIPVLERAVTLQSRAGASSLDLAASLKELADTHFYAGHFDLCDTLTRRSLAMHRELVGEHHPLVADDLINLGAVQFERGKYPEAERLDRQALAIHEAWYGEDNPATATTLSMVARALIFEDRYDEGQKLSERALAIQERVYGADHPKVANVLNELGSVALQRGKLDEAEARFKRTLEIYKRAYGEHHYLYGLGLCNLASVYMDGKRYTLAEPLFREAILRLKAAVSADDLNAAKAEIKLGRVLLGEKRYADAELETLAGYTVLSRQASPTVSWLRAARKDLVAIYGGLNQPEKAAQFRAAR